MAIEDYTFEKCGYKIELNYAYENKSYIRIYDTDIRKGVVFLSIIDPDELVLDGSKIIENIIERKIINREKIPAKKLEKLIKTSVYELRKIKKEEESKKHVFKIII